MGFSNRKGKKNSDETYLLRKGDGIGRGGSEGLCFLEVFIACG